MNPSTTFTLNFCVTHLKFIHPSFPPTSDWNSICPYHPRVSSMSLTNSRWSEQRQCLLSYIVGSMEKNNFASDPTELPSFYFSLEDGHRYSSRIVTLSMEQRTGENLVNPEEILPSYHHQNWVIYLITLPDARRKCAGCPITLIPAHQIKGLYFCNMCGGYQKVCSVNFYHLLSQRSNIPRNNGTALEGQERCLKYSTLLSSRRRQPRNFNDKKR
jgi:hypothetical protein